MNISTLTNATINITATVDERDKILIAVALYTITLITIAGNILVLVAVKVEKKLQTSFNYYIVNLAITDAGVAATAMSFKATHTVFGYWPFGEVLCGLWIFFDYGMTFVSVFTLILISVDRFWSVAWSVHYRQHHSKHKCVVSIFSVWLFMLALWVPPCVLDRIRHSKPGECHWDPSLNTELVFIVATLGHHGPCFIMIFCYSYVYVYIRKRANAKLRRQASRSHGLRSISLVNKDISGSASQDCSTNSSTRGLSAVMESRDVREGKIFVTLTYIIVAYVILWTPFHIIFDITIGHSFLVPNDVWEVGFWMTYLNSTINPFMYAFSSEQFRNTFKSLLGMHSVQCNCRNK